MAGEPDNLVLQPLREIRGKQEATDAKVNGLVERVNGIEVKLDGLTHAVIAGFGSLVHEFDDVKRRLGRLERERA